METEYEATFWPINKEEMRKRLLATGAILIHPERLMRRFAYNLAPSEGVSNPGRTWARVRDEGDKITMSIKSVTGSRIEDQKEAQVIIDTFENGNAFLIAMGCSQKAYQESYRELWKLYDVEIMLDTWPFLEPFVEIEGHTEVTVRSVSEKLGFDWTKAHFGNVGSFYVKQYGITEDRIYNHTPRLAFDDPIPF